MNEIQVLTSLQVVNGNLVWRQGQPTNYTASMGSQLYPGPGGIIAANTLLGTKVPLTYFSGNLNPTTGLPYVPGLVWMVNTDAANNVEYGVYDPGTETFYGTGTHHDPWFYPVGLLLPGMIQVWYLSPNVLNPNLSLCFRAIDPSSVPSGLVLAGTPVSVGLQIFGV